MIPRFTYILLYILDVPRLYMQDLAKKTALSENNAVSELFLFISEKLFLVKVTGGDDDLSVKLLFLYLIVGIERRTAGV